MKHIESQVHIVSDFEAIEDIVKEANRFFNKHGFGSIHAVFTSGEYCIVITNGHIVKSMAKKIADDEIKALQGLDNI